jgi:conserved hypothetical protein
MYFRKEEAMKSNKDILEEILNKLDNMTYISPSDIPNIELYMDQVTTFMDEHLKANKRNSEDKILTKTMINNYTKNRLLPPPAKKKYSRQHLLLLIFIYYYKSLLSFADIENILKPIIQDYFFAKNNPDISLNEIYRQIMELNIDNLTDIKKDLIAKFDKAQNTFKGAACKSHEQLVLFSFTSELLFDIYLKKRIVERISEYLSDDEEHTKK